MPAAGKKNPLEWLVFGGSLLILLFVLGYLAVQALQPAPDAPDIVVRYRADPSGTQPHRYRLMVQNTGGRTAEEVQIEAAIVRDTQVIEAAGLLLTFVPKESEEEGWVNFSRKPAPGESLVVRVLSYQSP